MATLTGDYYNKATYLLSISPRLARNYAYDVSLRQLTTAGDVVQPVMGMESITLVDAKTRLDATLGHLPMLAYARALKHCDELRRVEMRIPIYTAEQGRPDPVRLGVALDTGLGLNTIEPFIYRGKEMLLLRVGFFRRQPKADAYASLQLVFTMMTSYEAAEEFGNSLESEIGAAMRLSDPTEVDYRFSGEG